MSYELRGSGLYLASSEPFFFLSAFSGYTNRIALKFEEREITFAENKRKDLTKLMTGVRMVGSRFDQINTGRV